MLAKPARCIRQWPIGLGRAPPPLPAYSSQVDLILPDDCLPRVLHDYSWRLAPQLPLRPHVRRYRLGEHPGNGDGEAGVPVMNQGEYFIEQRLPPPLRHRPTLADGAAE